MRLKKDFAQMTLACLYFVAAVLVLLIVIPLIGDVSFVLLTTYLGIFIFFVGMTDVLVCKLFGKKNIAGLMLFITGVVVSILLCIAFFHALSNIPPSSPWLSGLQRFGRVFESFAFLVAFGLTPLVFGIKKVFCQGRIKDKVEAA